MDLQPVKVGYELFVDGSPGPKDLTKKGWSGWGVVLMVGNTPVYEACGHTAERVTTPEIELEALIQGLAYLLRLSLPATIRVWSDNRPAVDAVSQLPRLKAVDFCDVRGHPLKNAGRLKILYDIMYSIGMADRCFVSWMEGHRKVTGDDPVKDRRIMGNNRADELSKLAAYHGEVFYIENPNNKPQSEDEET